MTSMITPAGGDDDVLLEQQLVLALSAASHAVETACTPVLEELSLTHPQYLVMLALWETNPRPAQQIGELFPEAKNISPVLLQLVEDGYIQSAPVQDLDDRVSLTAKGTALHARALATSGMILDRLGLTPADAEELYSAIPCLKARRVESSEELNRTKGLNGQLPAPGCDNPSPDGDPPV